MFNGTGTAFKSENRTPRMYVVPRTGARRLWSDLPRAYYPSPVPNGGREIVQGAIGVFRRFRYAKNARNRIVSYKTEIEPFRAYGGPRY